VPPLLAARVLLALISFALPGGVKVTPDVVYGSGEVRSPRPGRKPLLLDLYEPAREPGATRYPGVVLLHPGAWLRGDRRTPPSMADLCADLAARGYVCASIDYRLQGDDPPGADETLQKRTIEASVADAELAVRWMVANAARHGVDPTRIAVGGASAGAGTALLLTYGPRGKALPIRAALDFWGGLPDGRTSWIERGEPPILIVHGTDDEITPFSVAEALAARAKEVGVPHELVPVPGGRHNPPLAPYLDRIARFLAAQLR
jgi:acetyl esterase/lipase